MVAWWNLLALWRELFRFFGAGRSLSCVLHPRISLEKFFCNTWWFSLELHNTAFNECFGLWSCKQTFEPRKSSVALQNHQTSFLVLQCTSSHQSFFEPHRKRQSMPCAIGNISFWVTTTATTTQENFNVRFDGGVKTMCSTHHSFICATNTESSPPAILLLSGHARRNRKLRGSRQG